MIKYQWNNKDHLNNIVTCYKVQHHAGRWEFFQKYKSDEKWEKLDIFSHEVMIELRKLLWKKYSRRRITINQINQIDKIIEENY